MPDWFNERHERRGRELSRNDLGHAVIEHLGGQGQADEQPKPLVQRDVLDAPTIEVRPDEGSDRRDDQQPERLHPIEHRVAAVARVDERRRDTEQMRRAPGRYLPHRPVRAERRKRKVRIENQAADDLRGQRVQAEVDEGEAEGDAGGQAPTRHGRYFTADGLSRRPEEHEDHETLSLY